MLRFPGEAGRPKQAIADPQREVVSPRKGGRSMGNYRVWQGLRLTLLAAAILLVGARTPAAADVDLTGSWRVEVSLGSPVTVAYFTFAQSGTDLTLTRSDLASGTGTIQPATGAFSFNFGPYTDPNGPPGPDHILTGVGAPDSQSFTGQENVCIFEIGLGWGCLTLDLEGEPGIPTMPVCGNGVVEDGEECDHALSNGPTCCTTACTLVDPDGDNICDLLDNCPRVINFTQADQDNDRFGDACDASTIGVSTGDFLLNTTLLKVTVPSAVADPARRLLVRGSYNGALAIPTTLQVRDIADMIIDLASLPAWTDKVCQSTASSITCRSPDGALRLKVSSGPTGSVRVTIVLKNPPLQRPFVGPLFMSLHSPDGGRRAMTPTCKLNPAGSIKCRG